MKKSQLITFILLFLCFNVFCEITVVSGRNNLSMLKNAKPIYILYTFNGTQIYKVPMDEFINNKKVNPWRLTRDGLIKECLKYATEYSSIYCGRWGMKVISNMSQAKSGFVMVINYDSCSPVPPVGTNGYATATVYKIGIKGPIITFKIHYFKLTDWDVKLTFPAMGDYFINAIRYEILNSYRK